MTFRSLFMLLLSLLLSLPSPGISQVIIRSTIPYQPTVKFNIQASNTKLLSDTKSAAATSASVANEYILRGNEPIYTELMTWATNQGWELYWGPHVSWRTLRTTKIDKSEITAAVTEVIDILREEGKPVRLRISEGNQIMEVLSTEVRN